MIMNEQLLKGVGIAGSGLLYQCGSFGFGHTASIPHRDFIVVTNGRIVPMAESRWLDLKLKKIINKLHEG